MVKPPTFQLFFILSSYFPAIFHGTPGFSMVKRVRPASTTSFNCMMGQVMIHSMGRDLSKDPAYQMGKVPGD